MAQKFKTNVDLQADVVISGQTANTVPILDGSKKITSSSVTSTQLSYVDATSSIQTQLNDKVDDSEKGAAGGVATLDGGGKVPASQLPSSVMDYKGNWDASTNTPTLANGTGSAGDVYKANVAGSTDFGAGSISFSVGDWAVYNGTIWEKSLNSNSVVSVNGFTGIVVIDTDDIAEGANLYFTDERAQDAVGTILVDTASVDLVYTDGTPSITATVLPAGVDHNSLLNFVANKHIDHSAVEIQTNSNSGLSGGGDITSTRSLVVDITGTTAETVPAAGDEILIYDVSASARRKMTRANFLTGIAVSSPGDINETSFSAANNQVAAANVTGLAFANGVVRSFEAQVSVSIDATSDLFESFRLMGIQKGASWEMAVESLGDNSGVTFTISAAGQVEYTSTNISGFVTDTIRFRATTTSF